MAKGFTVKADVPKKKAAPADEISIEKAKELLRGKTVVLHDASALVQMYCVVLIRNLGMVS